MAFGYLFHIRLAPTNTGLTLNAILEDETGASLNFADATPEKTTGFDEKGNGEYTFYTDQFPDIFPFTCIIRNDADNSFLASASFNEGDIYANVKADSIASVADAVWDETLADHLTAGTTGAALNDAGQAPGPGAIEFTYTVDDGSNPIDGAEVWITTDSAGNNTVWYGVTDAFGIARDSSQVKPWLNAGTYYFWVQKSGYTFANPDSEEVS